MEQRLTDEEQLTLKTGAFGAVFLVSNADPGVLAMIRESIAASGAFADASGVVKEALTTGPLPQLPRDSRWRSSRWCCRRWAGRWRSCGRSPRGRRGVPLGGAGRGRPGGRAHRGVAPPRRR